MTLALAKCAISRNLTGKVDMAELKEAAAEHERDGMAPDAAMIRAVEDKIADLKGEQRHVMAQVRAEYDKRTGRNTSALYAPRDAEGTGSSIERPQSRQEGAGAIRQASDDQTPSIDAASVLKAANRPGVEGTAGAKAGAVEDSNRQARAGVAEDSADLGKPQSAQASEGQAKPDIDTAPDADGDRKPDAGNGREIDAADSEQIEPTAGNDGASNPAAPDLRYSRTDDEPTASLAARAQDRLAAFLQTPRKMLREIRVATVPMGEGSDAAKRIATDFADRGRVSAWQWGKFDEVLTKNFTPEQLERMWTAADEENNLRREGRTSDTEGLASLTPEERSTVETLHQYGESLMQRARDAGMFEGTGVPYWTPRMAVMIGEDGSYSRPMAGPGTSGKDGRNLSTSASSLKQRKYLTSEETEAAMQARLDDGDKTAQLVRNIRTMPMAMARLENAIAGRELVNQIRALGQATGRDLVTGAPGADTFTLDHPALKTWVPELKDDGSIRLDEDGHPVMMARPLYLDREFEGPIKAVLDRRHGLTDSYNALMTLKSKSMGLIMLSPAIHFAVEYGRALPAMLTSSPGTTLKNAVTLGAYSYWVGNRAKNDMSTIRSFVEAGLVPIGGNGARLDITGIADPASLEAGKSWTAKAIGAGVGLIAGEKGADAAKRVVDGAGRLWHETLLWDRIADLQMGLAVTMHTSLINKGLDDYSARVIASHFANRYAGALPKEAMSQAARELLNVSLFSRSFTIGNIASMKDMFAGLPSNRQAQLRMHAFEMAQAIGKSDAEAQAMSDKTAGLAQKASRNKAIAAVVLDVAAMYLVNSLMQDWIDREKLGSWKGWREAYADRAGALGDKVLKDPIAVLAHPFNSVESLTSTSDHPEGKEGRIRTGEDAQGNSIYIKLPFGKVGEELLAYSTPATAAKKIRDKLSPQIGVPMDLLLGHNKDGIGRPIVDESKDASVLKQAGQLTVKWLQAQVPYDQAKAAVAMARGTGDEMDAHKVIGPLIGLTYSKVTGGDQESIFRKEEQDTRARKTELLPEVRDLVKESTALRARQDAAGADKAYAKAEQLLIDTGLTQKEVNATLRNIADPKTILTAAQMKAFNAHASDELKAKMDKAR